MKRCRSIPLNTCSPGWPFSLEYPLSACTHHHGSKANLLGRIPVPCSSNYCRDHHNSPRTVMLVCSRQSFSRQQTGSHSDIPTWRSTHLHWYLWGKKRSDTGPLSTDPQTSKGSSFPWQSPIIPITHSTTTYPRKDCQSLIGLTIQVLRVRLSKITFCVINAEQIQQNIQGRRNMSTGKPTRISSLPCLCCVVQPPSTVEKSLGATDCIRFMLVYSVRSNCLTE